MVKLKHRINYINHQSEKIESEIIKMNKKTEKILEIRLKKLEWKRNLQERREIQKEESLSRREYILEKQREREAQLSDSRIFLTLEKQRIVQQTKNDTERTRKIKSMIAEYSKAQACNKRLTLELEKQISEKEKRRKRERRKKTKNDLINLKIAAEVKGLEGIKMKMGRLQETERMIIEGMSQSMQQRQLVNNQLQQIMDAKLGETDIRRILGKEERKVNNSERKGSGVNKRKPKKQGKRREWNRNYGVVEQKRQKRRGKEERGGKKNYLGSRMKKNKINSRTTLHSKNDTKRSGARGGVVGKNGCFREDSMYENSEIDNKRLLLESQIEQFDDFDSLCNGSNDFGEKEKDDGSLDSAGKSENEPFFGNMLKQNDAISKQNECDSIEEDLNLIPSIFPKKVKNIFEKSPKIIVKGSPGIPKDPVQELQIRMISSFQTQNNLKIPIEESSKSTQKSL